MRPDGLSSAALNRGLHLHESRDLPFPFSPSSHPFISCSGVAAACPSFAARVDKSVLPLHLLPAATEWSGGSALANEGEMMNYTPTVKYSAARSQLLVT